ncbi:unnamed protein product [Euphydryas editha]|uniref:Uncharacterized protein n=1 Tax=Euphydryas editha TaxID=104508 RepID=A0AAU9U7J5_EUPED|nr:unnamed protein product [Euphydryas editha]
MRTMQQLKHLYKNMNLKDRKALVPNHFDSAASYFKDDFSPEKFVEETAIKTGEPFTAVDNQIVVCEIVNIDHNIKEWNEKPRDHNIKKNKIRNQQKIKEIDILEKQK